LADFDNAFAQNDRNKQDALASGRKSGKSPILIREGAVSTKNHSRITAKNLPKKQKEWI
jgi:hypothetical protein